MVVVVVVVEVGAVVGVDRTEAASAAAPDQPKTCPAEVARATKETAASPGPCNRVEECWKCTPTGTASFAIPPATTSAR